MKSGVFDWDRTQYENFRAANKSGLDCIERSPLHYWARFLDPNREPEKDTPAKALGTAIHCAVLEPQRFEQEYRAEPTPETHPSCLVTADDYKEACRNLGLAVSGTKDTLKQRIKEVSNSYAFFDDVYASYATYKLLSAKELDIVRRIYESVRNSTPAQTIFSSGKAEQSVLWVDKQTGVQCKALVDWISNDCKVVADLKSAEDASPAAFARACATYNYHRQAAWYADGAEAATGVKPDIFLFVVYEKEPPFASAFYYATLEMVTQGRDENRVLLDRYAECLKSNSWEGYPDLVKPINLPAWRRSRAAEHRTELY